MLSDITWVSHIKWKIGNDDTAAWWIRPLWKYKSCINCHNFATEQIHGFPYSKTIMRKSSPLRFLVCFNKLYKTRRSVVPKSHSAFWISIQNMTLTCWTIDKITDEILKFKSEMYVRCLRCPLDDDVSMCAMFDELRKKTEPLLTNCFHSSEIKLKTEMCQDEFIILISLAALEFIFRRPLVYRVQFVTKLKTGGGQ